MKRYFLILGALLLFGTTVKAQQDALFTHYMYNTLWLNPAYAGSRDALTVTGIYRQQWSGFYGAPVAQTLTMHSPIFNGKMGIGLSVINDKIGPTKNTTFALDLAYRLQLDKRSTLSFGLKGLVNFYRNDLNSLRLEQQADVVFAHNFTRTLPNAGAGIYYSRERFYAGFSAPILLQNKLNGSLSSIGNQQRHYYFIMGAVFDLNEQVKLKPTCFIRATAGAPIQGDMTANFIFADKLTLGAMYRNGDGAGILLGYNFSEQFGMGYSFDWSMANTTRRYNSGSHEIMLRYDLVSKNRRGIRSTRYF